MRAEPDVTQQQEAPAVALRRLINGYQASQAIHVAATLGIADLLADGPLTSDELAGLTSTHPPSLYRVLRALASLGVFREDDERRFALTPLGDCLRSDAEASLRGWAALAGRPYQREAWNGLLHSVRTGENAFQHVHGTGVWEYRAQHPEESAIFDRAMTDLSRLERQSLLDAYDFGRFGTVADVGGGHGALLAAILARYPALQGVLFDQPHVVAKAGEAVTSVGVGDRCRVVAGDFFEAVPAADAHLLKSILHDWADAEATAILRSCRAAVAPDGALLVVERELGPPNERPEAKLIDLLMLVVPGGQERTIEHYADLFAGAGYRLVGATPTSTGMSVIEGAPV